MRRFAILLLMAGVLGWLGFRYYESAPTAQIRFSQQTSRSHWQTYDCLSPENGTLAFKDFRYIGPTRGSDRTAVFEHSDGSRLTISHAGLKTIVTFSSPREPGDRELAALKACTRSDTP